MRKTKKWAALLCAVLMAVTLWPMQAWAAETDGGSAAVTEERLVSVTPSYSYTFINPLLPPRSGDIALFGSGTDYAVLASDVGFPVFHTVQEAADYARSEFKKHDYLAAFMEIPMDWESIPQEQWDAICKEIGSQIVEEMIRHDPQDPTGGDYLLYHCYGIGFYAAAQQGVCRVVLRTSDYLSSTAQENEATKAANKIIRSLRLDGMSDREKLRAIYGWLCKNVTYDNSTPANMTEMLLQHSAYAALVKHTAVCQGYATAFYRLALMAGLDARVVTGTGDGEPHGCNIVKIDGKWYYVDATWDAGVVEKDWRFFLRARLERHELDEQGKAVAAQYGLLTDFTVKIGDLNGSEGVDVTDVAMLYTYLVTGSTGENALSSRSFQYAADVNGDDAIDVYDLQLLYETVCNG